MRAEVAGPSFRSCFRAGASSSSVQAKFALHFLERNPVAIIGVLEGFFQQRKVLQLLDLLEEGLARVIALGAPGAARDRVETLDTGVALIPLGAGTLLGTIIATALYRAIGPRWVAFLASAVSIFSAWWLAQIIHATANGQQILASVQTHAAIAPTAGAGDLRWPLLLIGIGFAMISITVQTLALEALKGEALSKATSLVLSTKLIFSSIGVAILTTLLVGRTHAQATNLIHQIEALVGQTAGALGGPNNPVARAIEAQIAAQAGTAAIQDIFWMIFFGSFILLAMSLLLPGRNRPMAASETPTEKPVPATVTPIITSS